MDLSFLKPLNGWRAFAGEVGIIVLGVLIALGASQLVENWQWRQQVKQADNVFRQELTDATLNAYMQLAIEPCLRAQLTELKSSLDGPAGAWRGMAEQLNWEGVESPPPKTPIPYSGSSGFSMITTAGWDNALANGTVDHLPLTRAIMLARAYAAAKQLSVNQREEEKAAAMLDPLGTDKVLSSEARLAMLQNISDIERILFEIRSSSRQVLLNAKQAGLGFTSETLHAGEAGNNAFLLDLERTLRGKCVKKPELD